jgi:thiosulfate/3-mercaptopyruvate sulfurtransferase
MLEDEAVRPALLDVRWDPGAGGHRDRYECGHIPGAAYLDLDLDLAGPPGGGGSGGGGGRHPLPAPDAFQRSMRTAGVRSSDPVVVYDAAGSMAAARAWWLLRYFGHPRVAVLDGGLAAWEAAGGGLAGGAETPAAGDFVARPGAMATLDAAGAAALAREGGLLDARAGERFRGETEPLDPVAGHIPGALSRPTVLNLSDSGEFLEPERLRDEFEALGVAGRSRVGSYCGSGVTAAHQILALELAGLEGALYPGSWSEWITDPERPVATGD